MWESMEGGKKGLEGHVLAGTEKWDRRKGSCKRDSKEAEVE